MPHRFLALVAILALALFGTLPAVAAPPAGPTSWHVNAGAGTPDSAVTTMSFYPSTITIDVGDSITWTAMGDAHTVTFLSGAPQPSPLDPKAETPSGGNTYDGTGFVNSGILPPGQSYTLTFTKAGTFPYLCLLHPGMVGTVVVQPAGTPYPVLPPQIAQSIAIHSQQDLVGGVAALFNATPPVPSQNTDGTTNYNVWTGDSVGRAGVMRFLPGILTIHVGDTVTWTDADMMEPHTVTFAPNGQYPDFPSPQAITPTPNTTYDGTTFANSGLIVPKGFPTLPVPTTTTYTLKFTKAGVYTYHCLLHDGLGMIGKIRVLSTAASTPTTPLVHVTYNPALGPILTDSQGRTLYFLTSEVAGQPTKCTGKCLSNWSPLTVPSPTSDAVEGPGLTGVLSVNPRPEGFNQVSYGEEPLYTFVGDKQPGDINGQGIQAFGGVWLAAQVTAFPLVNPVVATSAGAGTAASFVVSFSSSQPGQGEVYFGAGANCTGLVQVATQDLTPGTTTHTVQVSGNDLPGTVGDVGIQPGVTYSYKLVTVTKTGTEVNDNGGTCFTVTMPSAGPVGTHGPSSAQ